MPDPKKERAPDGAVARVMFEGQVVLQSPTPVSVGDDETARQLFGFSHKRLNYKALGVAVVDMPGERFVVSVVDVQAALADRGRVVPPTAKLSPPRRVSAPPADDKTSRIDRALDRAGLKLAGSSR